MADRIIEEIILKVGVDTGGLANKVGAAETAVDGLEDSVDGLTTTAKKAKTGTDKLGSSVEAFKFDVKALGQPLDKSTGSLDKFTESIRRNAAQVNKSKESRANFVKGLKSVRIPAAAAAAAIGLIVQRSIEAQVRTVQMANALGVSTQRLRDLQNLAKSFGATAEDLTQGLKNISEISSEAFSAGSGEKFDLFKEINIDLATFTKLSPDEQFIRFATAIEGVSKQGRKTEIQLALMQEEGFKLANTMESLAKNGEGALDVVRKLGGEINEKQVLELNKRWQEFSITMQGIILGLSDSLTPALQGALDVTKSTLGFFHDVGFEIGALIEGTSTWALRLEEINRRLNETVEIVQDEDIADQLYGPKAQDAERKRKAAIRNIEKLTQDIRRAEASESRKIFEVQAQQNKKIDEEKVKQETREKDFARRKKQREERDRKTAIASIRSIGLERLKDKLKELRERNIGGAALSGVEAGSSEAARLESERDNINPALRGRIAGIENQIKAEEKRLEEEKLKTARDSLKQLKKIADKDTTTIRTKTIN